MVVPVYSSSFTLRRIIFISFCLCCFSGCSVSERITYQDDEGLIPNKLLKKVKKNKTDKAWIVASFGQPYTIDRVETYTDAAHNEDSMPMNNRMHSGMMDKAVMEKAMMDKSMAKNMGEVTTPLTLFEVYTYRFTRSQIRSGHALFFFNAAGRKDDVEYYHVAFDENIVRKSWIDKYPRAQLGMRKHLQKIVTHRLQSQEKSKLRKNRSAWRLPSLKKWLFKGKPEQKPVEKMTPIQAALAKQDSVDISSAQKPSMTVDNTVTTKDLDEMVSSNDKELMKDSQMEKQNMKKDKSAQNK